MPKLILSCRAVVVLAVVAIAPASPLTAAEVSYYPDDTELVVTVNLKQIFASEMIKAQPDAVGELREVLGRFAGIDAVQKYLKEVGTDAFRDLHSVTYVCTGAKEPRVNVVILKGEFDAGKWEAAAKADRATVRLARPGKRPVYGIAPRGEGRVFAALVCPSVLVAATTEASLADALARADESRKTGLKPEMSRLLSAGDDRQSVTFVSTGAAFSRLVAGTAVPNIDRAAAFLQTLDALSGGLTLAKDIQFRLAVNAESEATAKKLTESANGGLRILLTLVRQTAEKDAKYLPVADVVTGLRFTSQGSGILFRGEVTLDTVEKLIKSFPVGRPSGDRK